MFESRLDQALEEAQRGGRQVALLYVDLDRFKQVNDSLGHPAGDTLIRAVASRLSAEVRHSDTVARLGGDEFAIILRNVSCLNDVNDVCARVVKDLSRPFDLSGAQSFIGASVGVAIAPQDGGDRNELIRKADIALYKAKTDGRNQFALFSPSLDDAVRYREEMDRDLRQALLDNDAQLGLVYQPVFASDGARINGVEALIRWLHPKRGLINPADFIPFAEESGLIEQLGEWVLRCALRDAVRWPELRLSVNISPVQIRNRGFTMRVLRLLQASGMDASRLELEITETALMEGSSDIAETLATLRRNGISIALDDFGTGYSSLSHIRDIAVDRVKIDRSFVSAIEAGNGRALIQAIVTLARANGLKLTAEGIETSAQMDFLKQVGCDEFQGYLLARPITADAIDTVVQAAQTPNQHSGAAKKAV
jgi:diguanylate cyclase (GGDEF)-like protein